jgi:hypothetical protein
MTRSFARLLLACCFLATALLGAAPARAQPTSAEGSGTVRLASQTVWAGPERPFTLRLQIAGIPRPEAAEVRVGVHARLSSRTQFARSLEGEGLGAAITSTRATVADLLPTDAGGAITVRLDGPGLPLTRTGVYPVTVTLREAGGGPSVDGFVTHVVWLAGAINDTPTLGVAIVLPVHAPIALQANGTLRAPDERPIALLGDVLTDRRVSLTLAPTPETLDALARTNDEAADAALDDLRSPPAGRQVLASTYVPVDVPAMLAAGLDDLTALERLTGADTIGRTLDVRPDTRTWLDRGTLDEDAIAAVRELQVDQVVLPEERLVPIERKLTLAAPFVLEGGDGRTVRAAVADAGLAAHFPRTGDHVLAAQHLLADLAQLWLDAPQQERAVIAAAPQSWRPTRAFLEPLLDGLEASPILSGVTIDTLFRTIDPATVSETSSRPLVRRLRPREDLALLPAERVRTIESRLAALRATYGASDPTVAGLERRLLVAASSDLSASAARDYLSVLDRAADRALHEAVLPRINSFTLTAREGEIPITLLNRSDRAMTVLLRLTSDRLDIQGANTQRLELPPRSTTVRIPVQARAPGEFPVRIELLSGDGRLVLGSLRFRVRSTAPSGVGVILTAGAGVFLAVWWGRHMIRGRRARRLVPA